MASIPFLDKKPVIPVLRMEGMIAPKDRFNPSINLASLQEPLKKAFEMSNAQAVALVINSPGGRPAQSKLIHDHIRHLAEKHELKVLVFCEDLAASGGYMIACAGDVIYCDDCSILGSIGVIGASFGLKKLIEKYGIERRVYTAGTRKSMLDPFDDEKPQDVAKMKEMQSDLHDIFISMVKKSRGEKLKEFDFDILFSGEFWVGPRAIELGLADELGNVYDVCKKLYGPDVKFNHIKTEKKGLAEKMLGASANQFTAAISENFVRSVRSEIERERLWNKFGG